MRDVLKGTGFKNTLEQQWIKESKLYSKTQKIKFTQRGIHFLYNLFDHI